MKACLFYKANFLVLILLCGLACSPKPVATYIKEADRLVASGKTHEAMILYQKAIVAHPDAGELLINQAALFRTEKKHYQAIRNYEAALKLQPNSVWPYIGLARVYLAQKKYDKAREIIDQGLNILEDKGALYFYRGRISFATNKGDEALLYFNKALDNRYPRLDNLYYYRALTQDSQKNNFAAAKLDYESFLLTNSKDQDKIVEVKKRLSEIDPSKYQF